jgi:repressor LexA
MFVPWVIAMFVQWIVKGLAKHGKDQKGLAKALGVDRSSISKLLSGVRQLKADEIEKIAAYLEEPPPSRMMPVRYRIGAGQAVYAVDTDDAIDYEPVSGMWGVEAELAIVDGDSMWPLFERGARIYIGPARGPLPEDHRRMRVVRLADDRMLVKTMIRTADPSVWTLQSLNAPPIEDVVVVAVAPIIRIEP